MTPVRTTMGHPTSLPPLNDFPPPLLLIHPMSLPPLDDSPPPPPLNDSSLSLEFWLEI